MNQGSLYPALYRLERKGWIEADWEVTVHGAQGESLFHHSQEWKETAGHQEESHWEAFSLAVNRVLGTA